MKEKTTVQQLREAGIPVRDVKYFLDLLGNIAFLRGENESVENCICPQNLEESWYIGTIGEARKAVQDGPYW